MRDPTWKNKTTKQVFMLKYTSPSCISRKGRLGAQGAAQQSKELTALPEDPSWVPSTSSSSGFHKDLHSRSIIHTDTDVSTQIKTIGGHTNFCFQFYERTGLLCHQHSSQLFTHVCNLRTKSCLIILWLYTTRIGTEQEGCRNSAQ